MTASKMKKCPVLASNTSSQTRIPTYHKQNNTSSNYYLSTTSPLLSSSFNYNCGETTSASASSLRSKRIFHNYLSSANELTMIDGSADKQVDALLDNSMNNNNNLESRESKLNLTCCHGIKGNHDTKETNTIKTTLPHSFSSNEQLKSIVNKNIQLAPQHWRWKRWYETWLCSRQIGQIKSKRTTSSTTIATSAAMTTKASVMTNMNERWFASLTSSWLSCFTTFLVVLSVMPFGVHCGPHERRLINDLMDRYQNLERPVFNESEALNLKFGLTLQQIIDVDEKNQILTTNVWLNLDEKNQILTTNVWENLDEKNQLLTTNVWLNLEWTDVNLKWNKSEYGDVEDIRIPPHKLWKPDVLMYNSADEAFDGTYPTNVVVTSSGSCTYIPPGIFKSTCKIDITWFPFDDQDCKMKFGSWTYNGYKLNLEIQAPEADTSSYVLNGEWALLGVPGERNEVFYECCEEPYLDITFIIKIRRRTLYYFFNLIVPCVLIASMAVLGFTLPPDSGEKLSLGVTVLLSLTVFQQSVSEAMPITSLQIPLLGVTILLSLTMFMSIVSATMPVTSDNPLLGVTILLSLTVFLNTVSSTMPVTSDSPILGVTILLSLTVFSQVVTESMPRTSDANPLLDVTVLLSLTVFSLMVTEMLPKVSDANPILGVTIMLSLTIFASLVGEMLPVSDGSPLIGVTIMLSITIFATIVGDMLPVSDATPLIVAQRKNIVLVNYFDAKLDEGLNIYFPKTHSVAIMLSITIFATVVGEMLPVSDATPLIGTYFNCIMFMVASSVVSTIMILNYHHRLADTHEMPNWVRCLFLQWIPWVLRMARPGEKITRKTIMMQNKMKELDLKERSSKSLLANVLDMDDDLRPSSTLPGHAHIQPHHPSHAHSSAPGGAPPPVLINNVGGIPTSGPPLPGGFTRITPGLPALPPGFMSASSVGGADPESTGNSIGAGNSMGVFPSGIQRELSMILKEIRVITDKIRDEEDTAAIENDWKFAAMVLDRLCLITFTLFTFIATIAVLLTAPHIIVS